MRLELTRRADYAIRTVIALARSSTDEMVPAHRIAEAMDIPARFLPQVMQDLVRAGVVEARLGRGGGYRLARDPRRLSLLEVIEAVEGDARRRTCILRPGQCDASRPCDVHSFFAAAQDALLMQLGGASIQDVLDRSPDATTAARRRSSAAGVSVDADGRPVGL